MVRMSSVDKNMLCSTRYSISEDEPLPEVPDYGARIQVLLAAAPTNRYWSSCAEFSNTDGFSILYSVNRMFLCLTCRYSLSVCGIVLQ